MQSVWGRFVEKCVEFVTDSAFVHVEVVLRLFCILSVVRILMGGWRRWCPCCGRMGMPCK